MSRPSSARNRPASAQSRTAWGDGIDNPAMDEGPAAMGSDMYSGSMEVVGDQHASAVQVHEPPSGFFFMFKKGIRCKFYLFKSALTVLGPTRPSPLCSLILN